MYKFLSTKLFFFIENYLISIHVFPILNPPPITNFNYKFPSQHLYIFDLENLEREATWLLPDLAPPYKNNQQLFMDNRPLRVS